MTIEIALAGNPNSGKTSLFNALTGTKQHVGNWPGVTVERKEGQAKYHPHVHIQDLPGIYSMSPYTPEERVARDYLLTQEPQVILNVVDATNLERSLYLSSQLLEIGLPLVLALNMSDILDKKGTHIDADKLSYQLGVPVLSTSATKKRGIDKSLKTAISATHKPYQPTFPSYDKRLEAAVAEIMTILGANVPQASARFYALKLFEGDRVLWEKLSLSDFQVSEIRDVISITEKVFQEDAESLVVNQRYLWIENLLKMVKGAEEDFKLSLSDKIDQIVTHRILALPIFLGVMWLVYFLSIQTVGTLGTDWVNEVLFGKFIPETVGNWLHYFQIEDWLQALILDGIIAGCGAVIGFVPQIFVLFFCLGILEDIGYMSRIAFVMDRIFRRFGLSGKSFIPMLIATGCGVPGIMASRTIENESDRRITIMTTTFMPCSAKLPIIALIAGAFFPKNPLIAPSAYLLGMLAIVLSGLALKKTRTLGGISSPFIMELPSYHLPQLTSVLRYASQKGLSFIKKAGTIIFVMNILIWFSSSYNFLLQAVDTEDSILASLGKTLAPVFAPLGFGNWRATVAAITGLVAKESVISTFGILYHVQEATETDASLWANLQAHYTALSAYSFLAFNLLCAPCFAAIGAIKREMASLKWTLIAISFQTLLAYSVSFILYQAGLFSLTQKPNLETYLALILLGLSTYALIRKPKNHQEKIWTLDNLKDAQTEN